MKYFVALWLGFVLAGCSKEVSYSISDVEAVGFEKDDQQIYQMVGAIDGWSGTLEGERVELYEFESSSKVNVKAFERSTQEGNISGWVDLCQVGNLLMISKGKRLAKLWEISMHNQAPHYTAAGGGGTLVNSRPCAQS